VRRGARARPIDWFAGALPGEPVVLSTQTANEGSMRVAAKLGFTEVERFEDYGAPSSGSVWSSVTASARRWGRPSERPPIGADPVIRGRTAH